MGAVQLNHPSVSWNHATLIIDNGSYRLRDNGSSNGTFVNDTRITETAIRDRPIRIGSVKVALQCCSSGGQQSGAHSLGCCWHQRVIPGINLTVLSDVSSASFEMVALMGPSGAGKTSLLETFRAAEPHRG